ncbi:MAG TPA: hypothetical protein DCP46_03020 [Lachnospiraceae bacterium]|jgi:hypothetical protein|nr:hypothetical protein [Lachnospiraceae bacterium]MBQ2453885.1 hypothetical protein [Lachnospiraceae bacterium]MBQ4243082.1 hypothetical protein [Lachnospiraceae bacterium]MBQ5533812.1 hypothetical protein [Lachnospiraceae bacterium]MBQ9567060.1 hypothetical protein [Lachnospiraceae bacterium]
MRFDVKNPKFLLDLIVLIEALAIIVLTVIVVFDGSRTILAMIFYIGAAMFVSNVIQDIMDRRSRALLFIIPITICIAAALMAQGVVPLPELPF